MPWRDPVLITGLLFALIGILQLIPLPRPVLAAISPHTVEIRDKYDESSNLEEVAVHDSKPMQHSVRAVSLYPWATRRALITFLSMLLVTLIIIDLAGDRLNRLALAGTLVAGGAFQAIYGLTEYLTNRQKIFEYTKKYYTEVATGTFINRNHFAAYLALTLPIVIAVASALATRGWRRNPLQKGSSFFATPGRDLYLASALMIVALVMATAIASSRSRMGIISASLSIIAVALLVAWRSRKRGYAILSLVLGGGTVMLFSQGRAGTAVLNRFGALPDAIQGSSSRWEIWAETIGMIREFPVTGIGWGAYSSVFQMFRRSAPGALVTHAENDYLQILAETGVLGIAVLVAGSILVIRSLLRSGGTRPDYGFLGIGSAAGLVALTLHSLTDSILTMPSIALTASVLLGLTIAWFRLPAPILVSHTPDHRRHFLSTCPVLVMMALAALIALAPSVPYPETTYASSAGSEKRDAEALTWVERSELGMKVDGDNPERLLKMGAMVGGGAMADLESLVMAKPEGPFAEVTVEYINRRLKRAEAYIRRSLREMPVTSDAHVALADLRVHQCIAGALLGREQQACVMGAIPQLWDAIEVSPMSATAHLRVANVLMRGWGLFDEKTRELSVPVIKRAVQLNRDDEIFTRHAAELGVTP